MPAGPVGPSFCILPPHPLTLLDTKNPVMACAVVVFCQVLHRCRKRRIGVFPAYDWPVGAGNFSSYYVSYDGCKHPQSYGGSLPSEGPILSRRQIE